MTEIYIEKEVYIGAAYCNEAGGINLISGDPDTPDRYVDASDGAIYDQALAGDFGPIAAFIPEQEEPLEEKIAFARMNSLRRLNREADFYVRQITQEKYPDFEKQTFELQKQEAKAWEADNTALTPGVDILAASRQVDRTVLLQKILIKVEVFEQLCMSVAGQRQRYKDELYTMEDIDAISAKTFTFT